MVGRRPTTENLKELIALLNDKIKKSQELFEISVLAMEPHFSINFEHSGMILLIHTEVLQFY